ncbi:MAG: lytic transglycosylase domain-containing protein [Actinomycetota bacterium]|nr:lytic transglycosylase domain-containing protein [Actinomycetota bacterium]
MKRTIMRGVTAVAAAVTTGGLVFGAAASGSFVADSRPADASGPTGRPAATSPADAMENTREELRASRGDLRQPLPPTAVLGVRYTAPEPAAAPPAPPAPRDRPTDPRSIARQMLADRGWSDQWSCLNSLWERESNWQTHNANPHSDAYGIPQSLPGSKMASEGDDWEDNPATQIRWGLKYIAGRYGSPCAAYEHSNSYNWY